MNSIEKIFRTHDGNATTKWEHYFPIYQAHFEKYLTKVEEGKHINVLEIGVAHGGSLQCWDKFFNCYERNGKTVRYELLEGETEAATIVGLDAWQGTEKLREQGMKIEIGNQTDREVLLSLIEKYGPFDIVIDDGSHQTSDQVMTMALLGAYGGLKESSTYLIEDTHTSYWLEYGGTGGYKGPHDSSLYLAAFTRVHFLNVWHHRETEKSEQRPPSSLMSRPHSSIHFYDSVIVFENSPQTKPKRFDAGKPVL